jgi:ABC-2 type transport system ATP-binding protein
MGPPALEVRALVKRFRSWPRRARTVLEGIELTLAPGATLGLVGPNGSGKSTLLAILAGVEPASAGTVRAFGLPIAARAARRRVGYVPDDCPFPPELAPRALLAFLGALFGLARRERRRRADELLARVGLAAEATTPLAELSLGMRRRFALAQALVHAPDVVLLDEPSAGLDAEGTLVLDELLAELRARGAALLVASHVLGDLQDHCAEACVLLDGRIRARGATAELLRDRGALLALYRRLAPRGEDAACSG